MISVSDITRDHRAYAAIRTDRRADMLPIRESRRLALGDLVGLEFENSTTLTFQIQEMVFTERLSSDDDVQAEIDAYARMLPTDDSLVATFFIYLRNPEAVTYELKRLQGLHTAVRLEIGPHAIPGIPIVPAGQDHDDETVSVHVLRFQVPSAAKAALLDPTIPAAVVVDHPEYHERVSIPESLRSELISDLTA